MSNICVTDDGEAFIIDFSHASRTKSERKRTEEMEELRELLGMDEPVGSRSDSEGSESSGSSAQ